jgi:hypothetical protein
VTTISLGRLSFVHCDAAASCAMRIEDSLAQVRGAAAMVRMWDRCGG